MWPAPISPSSNANTGPPPLRHPPALRLSRHFPRPGHRNGGSSLDAGPDLRSRPDGDLDRDGMEPLQGAGPKPVGARLSGRRRDRAPGQDDRVNGAKRTARERTLSTRRMAPIASAMRDGSMVSFEKGASAMNAMSQHHSQPNEAGESPLVRDLKIPPVGLSGTLHVPSGARAVVLFAHGSGSSRFSPRNQAVADALNKRRIGTLLFDLLTPREETDRANVFDIALLAQRLEDAV